jgi:hypothetical protein
MGSVSIFNTVPATVTPAELQVQFFLWREQAANEYGSDRYSGSWNTLRGLQITSMQFTDMQPAYDWLEDHMQKWEDAIAVQAVEALPVRQTYGGKTEYSSDILGYHDYRTDAYIVCDQLTPAEQKRARELLPQLAELERAWLAATATLGNLTRTLNDPKTDIQGITMATINEARRNVKQSRARYAALHDKAEALRTKLRDRLAKAGTTRRVWLVGGLAAC